MSATSSSEVSKKLRAAIRAKLEELGVYVDEELPDYIMVMIANKKEKKQMKDDLSLFLSKNTDKFVDWLFDIFERLQAAPKASSPPPPQQQKTQKSKTHSKKESSKTKDGYSSEGKAESHDRKSRESAREREKEREREILKERERERENERERELEKEKEREREREREREERELQKEREKEAQKKKKLEEEQKQKEREKIKEKERQKQRSPHRKHRSEVILEREKRGSRDEERRKNKWDEEMDGRDESINRKVASQVVTARLPPSPPPKKVASAVIVKRKIQPTKDVKAAKATTSMFMRAMNAASISAGYGSAPPFPAKEKEQKARGSPSKRAEVHRPTIKEEFPSKRAEVHRPTIKEEFPISDEEFANGDEENEEEEDEDEKIEVDLRLRSEPATGNKHRLITAPAPPLRKRNVVQTEESPPIKRPMKEPQFIITLKGGNMVKKEAKEAKEEERHERETITVISPRKERKKKDEEEKKKKRETPVSMSEEEDRDIELESTLAVSPPPKPSQWDGHITLNDEEESSDDEEAEIDKLLAATTRGSRVSREEQETLPPTKHLSRGDSYYSAEDSAPVYAATSAYPQYIPTPLTQSNQANLTALNSNTADPQHTSNVMVQPNKIMERCRFWPSCNLGAACIYIHPVKNCTKFPSCHFGSTCLYIHPQCKFDRNCANFKCPYMHSSKTLASGAPPSSSVPISPSAAKFVNPATIAAKSSAAPDKAAVAAQASKSASVKAEASALSADASANDTKPAGASTTQLTAAAESGTPADSTTVASVKEAHQVPKKIEPDVPLAAEVPSLAAYTPCRYGASCTRVGCLFKHPKECRFGVACMNTHCLFYHTPSAKKAAAPPISSTIGQYKWQAKAVAPASST